MVSIFGFQIGFHSKRKNGKSKDRQPGSPSAIDDASSNSTAQGGSSPTDNTTTTLKQLPTAASCSSNSSTQLRSSSASSTTQTASSTTSASRPKRPWVDPLSVHFAKPSAVSSIPAPLLTGNSLRNTPSAYEQYCGPGALKTPRSSAWSMSPSTKSPSSPSAPDDQTGPWRHGKESMRCREIGTQTSPGLMSFGSVDAERQTMTMIATPSGPIRAPSLRSRVEDPPFAPEQRPETSHGPAQAQMQRTHRPSPLNLEAKPPSSSSDGTRSAPDAIYGRTTAGTTDSKQTEKKQPQSVHRGTSNISNVELPADAPATSRTTSSTIYLPGTPAPISSAAQICHSPPITRRMPATPFPRESTQKDTKVYEDLQDN